MSIKDGKWEPWTCVTTSYPPEAQGDDPCDGHMVLVDVRISGGNVKHRSEEGQTFHIVEPPTLTKVWVCNKCGETFEE